MQTISCVMLRNPHEGCFTRNSSQEVSGMSAFTYTRLARQRLAGKCKRKRKRNHPVMDNAPRVRRTWIREHSQDFNEVGLASTLNNMHPKLGLHRARARGAGGAPITPNLHLLTSLTTIA